MLFGITVVIRLGFFTFSNNVYSISKNKFDQTEFCFQFDDDEPVTFAISDGSYENPALTFTINNGTDGSIEFKGTDNKKFKIFAREVL